MPKDITRGMGPSPSQSNTGEAIGHAEDYSKIVTNVSPDLNVLLGQFGEDADGVAVDFSWFTEGLEPPGKNAHPEKMEYTYEKVGSVEGKKNYQQHFYNSGYVTDAQRNSKMLFDQDDFSREQMNAFTKHANDIEYAICKNTVAQLEQSDTDPAMAGGIPYFMKVEDMACTVDAASGAVTTTTAHNLKTGDFVYFSAETMPTGLSADLMYYVRLDDTTPTKKFTLFDTIDGAVENKTTDQVKPSTAGTSVVLVKSNVIDLGGTKDYTVEDLNNVMAMAYYRGGTPTDAFMSGRKKRRFSQLMTAMATTNRKASERKMEEVVTTFESDYGTVNAHAHRMYNDNRIDILDMNYWEVKWWDRTHEVKGLPKTGSYSPFAIESWCSLKGTQPKASCSIIGIKRT